VILLIIKTKILLIKNIYKLKKKKWGIYFNFCLTYDFLFIFDLKNSFYKYCGVVACKKQRCYLS